MATYTVYQGDALWISITHDPVPEIDATWANWSGKWAIAATAGGTVLLSGDLTRSTEVGEFLLRIGPASTAGWNALATGTYSLTVEVNNTSVDYKKEAQNKLVVKTQGVANA